MSYFFLMAENEHAFSRLSPYLMYVPVGFNGGDVWSSSLQVGKVSETLNHPKCAVSQRQDGKVII